MPRRFVVKTHNSRTYYRIPIEGGAIQFQVTTPVGFHWRHIAVVTVKNDKASRAERYFFSTRASAMILPFEVMGKNFMIRAIANRKGLNNALNTIYIPP